jgi:transglutaminase-like putative cysteine protease
VSELVERLRYPRAGWISLVLLGVMALALAWSVQGANWLDQMDFLVPVALYAVIAGALLGMLRGSIVWALPIGALIGTGVVLWTVGGEYYPALDQAGRLLALRTEFIDWLIVVLGTGYPPQLTPYAIGLGVLMFATAFAAAFAVYRHHRVLDAIVLLGAALIVNLSATLTDLFYQLLLFVVAAMLLWLRAALVDRQDGWQRRRVNETLEVPTAIMRSGILSAGAAIALAWLLTAVAVAAPLTDAWRSMDGVWTGVQDQFDSVFGSLTNPQSRISGNSFGSSFIVQGEWVSVDDEVLVLAAPRALYLRTRTYDIYNGHGWDSSESVQRTVDAGQLLFNELTSERSTAPDAVTVEQIGIEMRQPIGRDLFTSGSPLKIYAPAVVSEPFGQPLLGHIQHANALGEGQSYQQDVQLSTATEAELGAAGDDYPEEVADLYLDASLVTDQVADLAVRVTEAAGAENNYERARALASYLSHDPSFSYSTKAGVPPSDADLVDFFLFDPELGRSGYCQYFASAMVMMARSLGLPARLAAGFAPGERQDDDTFLVREANAHAWAEIYFPGYGWEIFEATKSINPAFGRASGDATSPGVPPTVGIDPFLEDPDLVDQLKGIGGEVALPSPDPVEGAIDPNQPDVAATDESSRGANALLIAVLVLGGLIALWARMNYLNRRWRLLPAGDRAWRQLTAAAGRAGVGPRPSETIYEYAGWLEDQLPDQTVPIQTVADGKVWQSYSGRGLTLSGAHKLENALRQLRWPLVWLAVRRWAHRFTRRDGSA